MSRDSPAGLGPNPLSRSNNPTRTDSETKTNVIYAFYSKMSQTSKSQRSQRDRNGDVYSEKNRQPQSRRDYPSDRRSGSGRSSSRPSQYSRSSQRQLRSSQDGPRESKWSHICSTRGIVLICAVLTNILVLICVVAAQLSQMGMSQMGLTGVSFNDAIIPFQGTELQQVRDLDMQYGQMRAPGVYGGVAFSLTFAGLSLLFVVSSSKPAHLLPRKLLIGQFVFQIVGAVAYLIAVALYLHLVISVNSTDVCTLRERLYARNGYTWMNCSVGGGDAAVALFGIITIILYVIGAILTGKTIKNVRNYYREQEQYNIPSREQPGGAHNKPLNADLYV